MENQTALARKELRNYLKWQRRMTPPLKIDPNHVVGTECAQELLTARSSNA